MVDDAIEYPIVTLRSGKGSSDPYPSTLGNVCERTVEIQDAAASRNCERSVSRIPEEHNKGIRSFETAYLPYHDTRVWKSTSE